MKLYNFFRSSASYRVRIAMALKGLGYDNASINLAKGEQHQASYGAVNPQEIVPTLDDNGKLITQSLAICEYLDETHPNPPILPRDPAGRARVRGLALAVACEIHPVVGKGQNYLASALKASEEQRADWVRHFTTVGFKAIETLLANSKETGRFCHGDTPTIADAFILPQVYNAQRAGIDLAPFPTIRRIYDECNKHPAFQKAQPERQPDAA
jgi:maleylacetoacetate isomerase